jgi:hypothetical protein
MQIYLFTLIFKNNIFGFADVNRHLVGPEPGRQVFEFIIYFS